MATLVRKWSFSEQRHGWFVCCPSSPGWHGIFMGWTKREAEKAATQCPLRFK